MENLTIRTNNQWRPIISGCELTSKEAKEFDYMEDLSEGSFFRYKGRVYSLGEFMRLDGSWPFGSLWHGYMSDSYFSGVLIRLSDCGELVKVGTYFS